ncbi:MAG: UDP-N-acetylmuramoyl-tripeptide--D-alanyl-D-alanine ligase, partial [Candidatus Gastranaerophilales bacterium]|nr:UDP-N-acetylmuramoyl-tripeptide--D-alanyl-D-alanine ligase [Candidatus Gastranaerophilales bacterium]
MKLSVEKLVEITGGKIVVGEKSACEFGISTDTRTIQKEELFIPLKGENFDGHDFIKAAVEKGCGGFFTEKGLSEVAQRDYKGYVIKVDDALEAYLRIARYARREINPQIVAVTGSAGKTSTKELIFCVLATTFRTHKSALNYNNEIGLCRTLLSMPNDTQYAVVEMGMRGLGEIELLSKYSEPDIAVITNVGTAHIGRLGSIENIAKAKCEITSYLKKGGLFLSHDDKLV